MSPRLLEWFNASEGVQAHALPYMRILFTCGGPFFVLFLLTGALQASGNPKIPLALGVLTTVLNIVLSFVFIVLLGLGAVGAALGTCLAPCVSVAVALKLIYSGKTIILPPRRITLIPDLSVLKSVVRIGTPTGLQAVVINIGGAVLLGVIGRVEHSAAAQAAYTICYAQLFAFIMWPSFGLRVAASTVMGQNLGAGKLKRGRRGVYVAAGMGLAAACVTGVVYWTLPRALLGLFDATGEAIQDYGASLLRFLSFSGIAFVLSMTFTGALQGAGDTKNPMYIAFVTQIVIPVSYTHLTLPTKRIV